MTGPNPNTAMINRPRLASLRVYEGLRFVHRTAQSRLLQEKAMAHLPLGAPMSWMSELYRTPPLYICGGKEASFTDVDGNTYLDFNLCDLSMTIGYGNEAVVHALEARARRAAHFLLPTEDALVVSKLLAGRMGLPYLAIHAVGVGVQYRGHSDRTVHNQTTRDRHLRRPLPRTHRGDACPRGTRTQRAGYGRPDARLGSAYDHTSIQ